MNVDAMYQEIILDHYKNPRGKGLLEHAEGESHQINPTCGDEITVNVSLSPDNIVHVGYEGQGCSISQASASVMSELVNNRSRESADAAAREFLELMQSKGTVEGNAEVLEDAVAFAGVSKYPARIKCALLPWMALKDAQAQALAQGDTNV